VRGEKPLSSQIDSRARSALIRQERESERFHIFPRSAQGHAAPTAELSRREGIPPAPLQHLQPHLACKSATQTCSADKRARATTTKHASLMRANHARLTPASLPSLHKSCGFARRARRGVAPTFSPTPSPAVESACKAGKVSQGAFLGCMGSQGVIGRAGSSEHGLRIQLPALPGPPPALGGLLHGSDEWCTRLVEWFRATLVLRVHPFL
jgi:hypothetical protein